jgi:periplasmic divalent cation tolerance protein
MDDSSPLVEAQALRVCLSTAPPHLAADLARSLVEEGLAACVNLVPGVRSIYRWKGAVQDDPESVLIIKAPAGRLPALAARLEALHPYEVPELLVLAPEAALGPYLAWATATEA